MAEKKGGTCSFVIERKREPASQWNPWGFGEKAIPQGARRQNSFKADNVNEQVGLK